MKDITTNMANVFDKLSDLKSLFKFGEKLVPLIQSLIEFMKDIVPLLETINTSISDTANKMPQASNQISNVTSANELATTEILDLVDKITNDVFAVEKEIKDYLELKRASNEKLIEVKTLIGDNPKAIQLIDEVLATDDYKDFSEHLSTVLADVSNSTYQITLSLQVQDITAQQLAAVNHLIESVHGKLASLITDIDRAEIRDSIDLEIKLPEGVHFDANAQYVKDETIQQGVDEIISTQRQQTSQDEIDKLFS